MKGSAMFQDTQAWFTDPAGNVLSVIEAPGP